MKFNKAPDHELVHVMSVTLFDDIWSWVPKHFAVLNVKPKLLGDTRLEELRVTFHSCKGLMARVTV